MTPASTFLRATVIVLLLAMLAGMVRAWAWALRQVREGRTLLPRPKPRSVPWGFGSILLVVLVYLLVNFAVMAGYQALTGRTLKAPVPEVGAAAPADRPSPFSFSEQMLLLSLANGIVVLIVPPLLWLTSGTRPADLGLQRQGLGRNIALGAVAFLLIAPVVYALNFLAVLIWQPITHPVERMVRTEASAGIAQLAILSAVILAPAAEELIFRAIIQSWLIQALERSRRAPSSLPSAEVDLADPLDLVDLIDAESALLPPKNFPQDESPSPTTPAGGRATWHAIFITSVLFAAVHLPQWPAPLAIFLLSLGLGLVYQRTGSLVAAVVMHALFNSLGTLVLLGGMLEGNGVTKKVGPPAGCIDSPTRGPIRSVRDTTDRHLGGRKHHSVRFSVGADGAD